MKRFTAALCCMAAALSSCGSRTSSCTAEETGSIIGTWLLSTQTGNMRLTFFEDGTAEEKRDYSDILSFSGGSAVVLGSEKADYTFDGTDLTVTLDGLELHRLRRVDGNTSTEDINGSYIQIYDPDIEKYMRAADSTYMIDGEMTYAVSMYQYSADGSNLTLSKTSNGKNESSVYSYELTDSRLSLTAGDGTVTVLIREKE